MDIKTAGQVVMDCQEMKAKIESTRTATEAQRDHAQQSLKELQESLPDLLAGKILGEVTAGEIREVKEEIGELEESINDAPLVIQGLELRASENDQAMAKAQKPIEHDKATKRYEELKSKMGDEYDCWLDGEIRQTGSTIGKKQEAHQLVEAWKFRLEHAGQSL